MARPSSKPSGSSPSNSSGGNSGVQAQIKQTQDQIDQEKLQQKQNQLSAEKVRTQITAVGIEIANINLETKQTSKQIASVRGEKERHGLTGAEQGRDLAQQLNEINKEVNEERIRKARYRLYEGFEPAEV